MSTVNLTSWSGGTSIKEALQVVWDHFYPTDPSRQGQINDVVVFRHMGPPLMMTREGQHVEVTKPDGKEKLKYTKDEVTKAAEEILDIIRRWGK